MPVSKVRNELSGSVVRVAAVLAIPDPYEPWTNYPPQAVLGSGIVVSGERILTVAHLVRHATEVEVFKTGSDEAYVADVLHIDDDRDLALISPRSRAFWTNTKPLVMGTTLREPTEVTLYGFPKGSCDLAEEHVIASPGGLTTYVHSRRSLPIDEVHVTVELGLSGGPAICQNLLVGVVLQSRMDGVPQTDLIPIVVLEGFWKDLSDGRITGVPDFGISWQSLSNNDLRNYLELVSDGRGILVTHVAYKSSLDGVVREGDVIVSIDNHLLDCNGNILMNGNRVNFNCLTAARQIGDQVAVETVRGALTTVRTAELKQFVSLVPLPRPSRRPTYLVFAGLVFVVLTYEYMSLWNWVAVPFRYKHLFYDGRSTESRREIIVVSRVLEHDATAGYQGMIGMVVERVNGKPIACMNDVVDAVQSPLDGRHVFEVDNHSPRLDVHHSKVEFGTTLVIDDRNARVATVEVLSRYGIPKDRSGDLIGHSHTSQPVGI